MSIFEYNQEAHMKCVHQEAFEEGKAEDILELLSELGVVTDTIREKILSTSELELLKKWLKLVAKSETIEQFMKEM